MRSRMLRATAIAFVGLASAAAPAAELELGVHSGVSWDDRSDRPSEDPSWRFKPTIRLSDEGGELVYDVSYQPLFEYYFDERGAEGWNHDLRGTATWRLTPRTSVEVSDRFLRVQSSRRFNELVTATGDPGDVPAEDVLVLGFRERQVVTNVLSGTATHNLSRSNFLTFDVRHSYLEEKDRRTTTTFLVDGGINHVLTETDTIGVGLDYTRQTSEPQGGPENSSDFIGVNGRWTHRFDPTLTLTFRGGPTLVKRGDPPELPTVFPDRAVFPLLSTPDGIEPVDFDSCPTLGDGTRFFGTGCQGTGMPVPSAVAASLNINNRADLMLLEPIPSPDDSDVTFFANVVLSKQWENLTGSISYRRQASSTASFGSSTIDDVISGSLVWKPARRWNLVFTTFFRRQSSDLEGLSTVTVLREGQTPEFFIPDLASGTIRVIPAQAVAESAGVRAIIVNETRESDTVSVRFNVRYSVTQNLKLSAGTLYQYTDNAGLTAHQVTLGLGFIYTFDPIHI